MSPGDTPSDEQGTTVDQDTTRTEAAPAPVRHVEQSTRAPQRDLRDQPIDREVVDPVFELRGVSVYYGDFLAVRDVELAIPRNEITALIGPSGCGKSTLLRTLNRMHDLTPGARVEGAIEYHGHNVYAPDVDPVEVRRRIGMVFQKPNPFPKSIFENVMFGARING